ncbi:MAG: transglycosylase domain-containing protein [Gemmatimonadaceae bacterium]
MRSRRPRRILRIIAILIAIVLGYLAVAGLWAYAVTPTVIALASKPRLVDLGSLPDGTVQILLRVEDPTFRKHKGLDPFATGQGRGTITRALARTLYLHRYDLKGVAGVGQSVFRFVNGVAGPADLGPDVMALVLNAQVSKDRQLRLFVQHAYMGTHDGRPVYGFSNAARAHFGKRMPDLTRRYVVALVGMMVDPDQFHPVRHPDALGERMLRIERLLRGDCKPRGARDVYYRDCAAPDRGDRH